MPLTPKFFVGALFIVLGALLCPRAAHAADPQWTMVWDDEFNGAANAPPDPTRWTYDLGGGGWGNGELETYTSATANVYQDGNGHLVIQAQDVGGNYTSARLKSFGLFDQAYGMIEASIELPAGTAEGSGLWPAFWMLGSNINTATWPLCGEIDIMENIGQYDTATENGGHIHGPIEPGGGDYNGGDGVGTTYTLPTGAMNTAFHLYAVSWTPTSIAFSVDGVVYQTLTSASLPSGGEWVFNHPFFIIMNLALGGPVGGAVTCTFPQQLLVDYVRVYKLTDNGTTPYGGTAPTLPGSIVCANYDSYDDTTDPTEPGEGFAYNALNSTQTNGVYRTGDAVSTEDCTDVDPYDCDYTTPGQWLQYTVNVAQSGVYTVDARVASDEPGGTFHIDVDGTAVTGEMTAPNTGGWQTWGDVTSGGITLTAGSHVVLLDEDTMGTDGVCNFEYLTFSLQTIPSNTPSRTPTLSATETATSKPSPSLSPSASPTASRTAASTPSLSPTLSATETATSKPSASLTPSASPTESRTAASTPSLSPTLSATETPTSKPSASLTPSASPTESRTTVSTPSLSPTLSATETATSNPSLTPSPSHSPSLSTTATATPLISATPSASTSPSGSPSPDLSATPTPSLSPSPSRSPSLSPTASSSPSSSPSVTASLSASPSLTQTASPTPPASVSPTRTFSASPTSSPVLGSPSPSLSATAHATETETPAALPSTAPNGGPPQIKQVAFAPQPVGGTGVTVFVLLSGDADELEIQLYSPAFVRVLDLDLAGNWVPGWNSRRISLPTLPNGVYYVVVTAVQGSEQSRPSKPARLMLLR